MESFVERTIKLLELERIWQWEESGKMLKNASPSQLQREGKALLNLQVGEMRSGLGGKCMIEMNRAIGGELPATKLQVGDAVCIGVAGAFQERNSQLLKGVVTRIMPGKSITIAIDSDEMKENALDLMNSGKLQVYLMPNEVSFERNIKALREMKPNFLSCVFFEKQIPHQSNGYSSSTIDHPFNENLDSSQLGALNHALNNRPLALIHGPPGTGKTMTLIEVILQLCSQNPHSRILVCGPSNVSVDNILERISPFSNEFSLNLVRIGHPARMLDAVTQHSLDVLCWKDEQSEIIRDLRAEIDALVRKLFFSKQRIPDRKANLELLSGLRKDLKTRERKLVHQIIDQTASSSNKRNTIIFSTLTGVGGKTLAGQMFDFVIIDECTQALESECWIAMQRASKSVLLAGDHLQLPPTVTCPEAVKGGLEMTLFHRIKAINPHLIVMLSIQYRMNERIMKLFSREFYSDSLECAPSVRDIKVEDLNSFLCNHNSDDEWLESLIFIDTQYSDNPRESCEANDSAASKANEKEAEIVLTRIEHAINVLEISPSDIAVISPYNAQVSLISSLLLENGFSEVEVGTVDGFQGREKEIILLSLVRSNEAREIGFLSDHRRLNVAVSRAKRQLILIGDGRTLGASPLIRRMIEHIENVGLVHCAQ